MSRLIILAFLLMVAQCTGLHAQGEHPYSDLWKSIKSETYPIISTHEFTDKMATWATFEMLNADEEDDSTYAYNFARAYYYQLLAGNIGKLDTFMMITKRHPYAADMVSGHEALKLLVPCFATDNPECRQQVARIKSLMKHAGAVSNVMPLEQWQWLLQLLDNELPYPNQTEIFEVKPSFREVLRFPSWEGGIVHFQRKAGSTNLFISNGPRFPVQILELDQKTAVWTDVSSESGLDSFPGGHRIYVVDYNNDKYDDLLILRKAGNASGDVKFRSSLLLNDGRGNYSDVALQAGFEKIERPNCACWKDINGDGLLDVFIGIEFQPSAWMIQQEDGSFKNEAFAFGVQTRETAVRDCAIMDFDGDHKDDLLLSIANGKNALFLQGVVGDKYRFFFNKSDSLKFNRLMLASNIIVEDFNNDGVNDIVAFNDISNKSIAISKIMSGNAPDKTVEKSQLFISKDGGGYEIHELPHEFSLSRSGILMSQADGFQFLNGGGWATETLLPMFIWNSKDTFSAAAIALPNDWPAYIHSATAYPVAESVEIVFKGGGSYPFMTSKYASMAWKGKDKGQFTRIFKRTELSVGDVVTFNIQSNNSTKELTRTVQATDSRGYNALQEWIWLPEGYTINNIRIERLIKKRAPVRQKKKSSSRD